LLAQKVTKKGPAIEYSPMAEGSLIKLCATVSSALVILLLGAVCPIKLKQLLNFTISDFSFVIAIPKAFGKTKRLGRNENSPFLPYSYVDLLCYCGFCPESIRDNSTLRRTQFNVLSDSGNY